jgi:hypothetical protein
MTSPLTALAELDEAIRLRCADDGVAREIIIQALVALARFVSSASSALLRRRPSSPCRSSSPNME